MALFFPKPPAILIQGLTGREASMVVDHMVSYGTPVWAGVTPGRGGRLVEDVPVFDTIQSAQNAVGITRFDASIVYVPPLACLDAVSEAVNIGIPFILVVSENIPLHDSMRMLALADERGVCLVGPNSVGIISPASRLKLGPIGGSRPERAFAPGRVGIISRSGGLTSEVGLQIKRAGLGVSTAVSVGGDAMLGLPPADLLSMFEQDDETDAVVLLGEPGTAHEEEVADLLVAGSVRKPVVAFVAGRFIEDMPEGTVFGHTGAIIEGGRGRPRAKIARLREGGALVAEHFDDIVPLLSSTLRVGSSPS